MRGKVNGLWRIEMKVKTIFFGAIWGLGFEVWMWVMPRNADETWERDWVLTVSFMGRISLLATKASHLLELEEERVPTVHVGATLISLVNIYLFFISTF